MVQCQGLPLALPPCIQPTSSLPQLLLTTYPTRHAATRRLQANRPPFTSSCIYWAATQSHCLPLLLRSWQPHLRRLATGYFQTHVRAHGRARPRRYMPVAYPDTKPVPPVSFEFGATDLSFAGPLLLLNLAKSFSTSNENANYRSLCRFLVNAHKTYCSAK